jgi:hypothetical protein
LLELKGQGVSNRAIAQRQGMSEKAIRKRLRRLGWHRLGWHEPTPAERQLSLDLPEEELKPAPKGADPNRSALPVGTALPAAPVALVRPEGMEDGADPNLSACPDRA